MAGKFHRSGTEGMQDQTLSCKDSEEPEVDPLTREGPRVADGVVVAGRPASLPKHLPALQAHRNHPGL